MTPITPPEKKTTINEIANFTLRRLLIKFSFHLGYVVECFATAVLEAVSVGGGQEQSEEEENQKKVTHMGTVTAMTQGRRGT